MLLHMCLHIPCLGEVMLIIVHIANSFLIPNLPRTETFAKNLLRKSYFQTRLVCSGLTLLETTCILETTCNACVLLLYMCPHTIIYVSSYNARVLLANTCNTCVLPLFLSCFLFFSVFPVFFFQVGVLSIGSELPSHDSSCGAEGRVAVYTSVCSFFFPTLSPTCSGA